MRVASGSRWCAKKTGRSDSITSRSRLTNVYLEPAHERLCRVSVAEQDDARRDEEPGLRERLQVLERIAAYAHQIGRRAWDERAEIRDAGLSPGQTRSGTDERLPGHACLAHEAELVELDPGRSPGASDVAPVEERSPGPHE